MKLYHAPMAPNPERVAMFLRAKGKLDTVSIEEVSIMAGDHKTPDYRAISPLSQVPALVLDDGTKLTESRAICTYFEGLYPEPNLMGSTPREKAEIEMWDRRVELLLFMSIAQWFRHSHPAMARLEVPQVPEWAASSETRARKMGEFLDAHLAQHDFVAADRLSIADMTLFIACGFAGVNKWAPHKEHESIAAWHQRIAGEAFVAT